MAEEEEEEEGEGGGRGSKGGFPLHHRGWPSPRPQRPKPGVWSHRLLYLGSFSRWYGSVVLTLTAHVSRVMTRDSPPLSSS